MFIVPFLWLWIFPFLFTVSLLALGTNLAPHANNEDEIYDACMYYMWRFIVDVFFFFLMVYFYFIVLFDFKMVKE